jgi:hypothetical protein
MLQQRRAQPASSPLPNNPNPNNWHWEARAALEAHRSASTFEEALQAQVAEQHLTRARDLVHNYQTFLKGVEKTTGVRHSLAIAEGALDIALDALHALALPARQHTEALCTDYDTHQATYSES